MEISTDDYINCLNKVKDLKTLETAIYNAMRLNYDGTRLIVADDNNELATVFKYAAPDLYEQKLNELQFIKTDEEINTKEG